MAHKVTFSIRRNLIQTFPVINSSLSSTLHFELRFREKKRVESIRILVAVRSHPKTRGDDVSQVQVSAEWKIENCRADKTGIYSGVKLILAHEETS